MKTGVWSMKSGQSPRRNPPGKVIIFFLQLTAIVTTLRIKTYSEKKERHLSVHIRSAISRIMVQLTAQLCWFFFSVCSPIGWTFCTTLTPCTHMGFQKITIVDNCEMQFREIDLTVIWFMC